jgi:uncharacterized membrane protein
MDETLMIAVEWVTRLLEAAGLAAILIGAAAATVRYFLALRGPSDEEREPLACYRSDLGRAILLGLEFLVAADIVHTVAIEPTLDSLAVLAGIVLIRTFLSFSLEVELEGRWPWQRARARDRRPAGSDRV